MLIGCLNILISILHLNDISTDNIQFYFTFHPDDISNTLNELNAVCVGYGIRSNVGLWWLRLVMYLLILIRWVNYSYLVILYTEAVWDLLYATTLEWEVYGRKLTNFCRLYIKSTYCIVWLHGSIIIW